MEKNETEIMVAEILFALSIEGEYLTDETNNPALWDHYND